MGKILVFICFWTQVAGAQNASITLTPEGQLFAAANGFDPVQWEQDIEQQIRDVYNTDYLRALADAASFSTKGIGVDYASNMKKFGFGIAANVSLAVGDEGLEEYEQSQPVGGAAANVTVWGGMNMKPLGVPRLNVYANFFQRTENFPVGNNGYFDNLDVTMRNLGIHGQVQLIKPTEGKKNLLFKWGGVAITSGFAWSHLAAKTASAPLVRQLESNPLYTMDLSLQGDVSLALNAFNIPVEVSTSARVLYFLSIYGGVGGDLQLGSASLDVNANAEVTTTDTIMGGTTQIGTGTVVVDGKENPSAGRFRAFAGLQANAAWFKTFVHLEYKPARAAALAFGLRFIW